jgi:hypothetical protein
MSATQDPHDDVIDVRPLGPALAGALSSTLARTPTLEVRRLVLTRGREIPTHQAPGEITVHCLEGRITFNPLRSEGRPQCLGIERPVLCLPPQSRAGVDRTGNPSTSRGRRDPT